MGAGVSVTSPSVELIHQKYLIKYQIGKGSFADVFLSIDKSKQTKVAMKRINILTTLSFSPGIKALSNELHIHKLITCHQNIVNLHCAYRLKNHFYFVMDCLSGGDLGQYIRMNGKISQRAISYVIACVGSGLNHMHQRGVFHRDIKPQNISFDSKGIPHLIDFGISHIGSSTSFVCQESSGTLAYLAPEVLTKSHQHSYHSDFWSLGIMAYELLFGRRPFHPHVPLEFIYFAANHYQNYWDRLEGLTLATSVTEENHQSHTHSQLPFPNYHVTLNQDGSAPQSLITFIPSTWSGHGSSHPIEKNMVDLLNQLLDVRVPERLGSMNRFNEFACHPAFTDFGCLQNCPSPLLEEDRLHILSGEIKRTFDSVEEDLIQQFSPTIEFKLDQLFYVSPSTQRNYNFINRFYS